MALSSGFFNSKQGDRKYNAREFGSIFDGIINDGVFSTIGNKFAVTSPEDGLRVNVGTGRAWFLHTWTYNSKILSVTIEDPHPQNDRWDTVILDIDHRESARTNSIKVKKGVPTSSPKKPVWPGDFDNSSDHKEVPLAYVKVRAGEDHIRPGDIDWRVGKSECPLVIAPVIDHITANELVLNWEMEFSSWMEEQKEYWDANMEHNAVAWWNWFNNLQYILDGDVAGHLQTQIDEIAKFKHIYVVDKVLYVPMSGASVSGKKLIFAR